MKWLYIAFFFFMLIFGGTVLFQETNKAREDREIRRFIATKGKTPPPSTWRNKNGIGKGI